VDEMLLMTSVENLDWPPFAHSTRGWPEHEGYCHISEYAMEESFNLMAVTAREPYFSAAIFYRESLQNVWLSPGDVQGVLSARDKAADSQVTQVEIESAVWNAYKAIEAIIGEPPKDERKYRATLIAHGINPEEKVGHCWPSLGANNPAREPMADKIRKMAACRDKRAGHGSRTSPDRRITYYELMDFQACARGCLLIAIGKELAGSNC
jgi:hypothetical protein